MYIYHFLIYKALHVLTSATNPRTPSSLTFGDRRSTPYLLFPPPTISNPISILYHSARLPPIPISNPQPPTSNPQTRPMTPPMPSILSPYLPCTLLHHNQHLSLPSPPPAIDYTISSPVWQGHRTKKADAKTVRLRPAQARSTSGHMWYIVI